MKKILLIAAFSLFISPVFASQLTQCPTASKIKQDGDVFTAHDPVLGVDWHNTKRNIGHVVKIKNFKYTHYRNNTASRNFLVCAYVVETKDKRSGISTLYMVLPKKYVVYNVATPSNWNMIHDFWNCEAGTSECAFYLNS